jgi:hypothetical protein
MKAPVKQGQQNKTIPPPSGTRWGSRRKAAVVLGLRAGVLTREEAFERYRLSAEELASWEAAFEKGGLQALSRKAVTRERQLSRTGLND